MGRELKRIAMDFDWPQDKVWDGYCEPNPHHKECPSTECENGYSLDYQWMDRILQMLNTAAESAFSRKGYPIHPWLQGLSMGLPPPTKKLTEIMNKLYGSEKSGPFSRSYDGVLVKILCEKAGVDYEEFRTCQTCKGHAIHPDHLEAYEKWNDEWKPTEPPAGDGYQLWETTSEGSPSSPVFASLDELCEWCASNATTFGSFTATKEKWMQMLNDDMVIHKEGNMVFL